MNGCGFVALGAALLLLPGLTLALEGPSEVSFGLFRGYTIVVQGSIGDRNHLNFIIDTGAVPTVVDTRIRRDLQLAGRAEPLSVFSQYLRTQRVVLPDLHIGPIRAKSPEVIVGDLAFMEHALGIRIDGMVGLDVLGSRSFSIDYKLKRILFGAVEPSASAVKFEAGLPYVIVQMEAQDSPVRLMVDTGAKDLILFDAKVRDRLPGLLTRGHKQATNLGGEVSLKVVQLSAVWLGHIKLGNPTALVMESPDQALPDFEGLLGVASLSPRRISFDFDRRTISWR